MIPLAKVPTGSVSQPPTHEVSHASAILGSVFVAVLTALLVVPPAHAQLIINEIDYDQPGTDAMEFVELKSVSAANINLDSYTLELVNRTGGGVVVYATVDLPNVNLASGSYYVICANATTVTNCDVDSSPDIDFIQTGAPDAVGLRLFGTLTWRTPGPSGVTLRESRESRTARIRT